MSDTIFPLTLTPFELYYWADNTVEYPTTFAVNFEFTGELLRGPFEAALRAALARHPLLAAQVDDSQKLPRWIASQDQEKVQPVDWGPLSAPAAHAQGSYFDLRAEHGLRAWVRVGDGRSRVVLQFHHACCDGLGMFRFAEDLFLCYYNALDPNDKLPLPDLRVEQLRERGNYDLVENAEPSLRNTARDILITAGQWGGILFRRPALVASTAHASSTNGRHGAGNPAAPRADRSAQDVVDVSAHNLPAHSTAQLHEIAAAQNVTLNDLLLRDGILALRAWNANHGGRQRPPIRMNVPVSLRDSKDRHMPAANRIGFAFVTDRQPREVDRGRVLQNVHAETERIKQWKLGLYFLGGLAIASGFSGVLPWALRRDHPFASMVMSNVGRPFADSPLPRDRDRLVVGNVTLERIQGAPPVRPLTRAAMAIFEYGGELTICLRADPGWFQPSERRELLEAFGRQLDETIRLGT